MRRGLLAWDKAEVPAAVLETRVARCQAAMAAAGLDALLVYTNFPRPAAVSWLTHFVPYWSQGVLLVPGDGPPEFFVSLSKRVAGWIADTSHMGEIVSTPRIGGDLAARTRQATRIGVVELDRMPNGIVTPFLAAHSGAQLEDATDLFHAIRHPADATEIAVSRHAAALAHDALAETTIGDRAGTLISAIEGHARLNGAEEVLVELAPDLDADTTLRRIEGEVPLGDRYAVRVSVAYKGHWVRYGRTMSAKTSNRSGIDSWLTRSLPALGDGSGKPAGDEGADVRQATLEACTGSLPLKRRSVCPPGSIATVSLELERDGQSWLECQPVLLAAARDGLAERLLPG